MNVLFVCSQNRLRSPTAEQVFAGRLGLEVLSAGTNNDADTPLSADLVAWADVIFVMEREHRSKVQRRFRQALRARLICLDIPDDYELMQPELVQLLEIRVGRHLTLTVKYPPPTARTGPAGGRGRSRRRRGGA